MSEANKEFDLRFSAPAMYRIRTKGFLDESWSSRLGGMFIVNESTGSASPHVVITGQVRDQAELIGILYHLYEMHLPLVSLELLNKQEAENRRSMQKSSS